MLTRIRPWSPPGPVAAAALASWTSPILLGGPVGSGKTGTLIFKAIAGAHMQNRWADGVRRARLLILKDDYRRLWANFIPSWLEWLPKHEPENGITWVGSQGGPAMQRLVMRAEDGGTVELEIHFMGLGDETSMESLEAFFAGLQMTWIWFNELQTLPELAYILATQRVGRYPRAADAAAVGAAVWGDHNAPIIDTWLHLLLTSNKLRMGTQVFRQPGAFEPGAENLRNLPKGYYERMLEAMPAWEIERKIHNRFGRRLDGEPVWDFDDNVFVAPNDLMPNYNRKLLIGMDAGLDPTAILGQREADGQLRGLDEIVCSHGVGPDRFGRMLGVLLDSAKYAPFRGQDQIDARADPSAAGGVDADDGQLDWMQRVAAEAGIRVRPAPTNDIEPRLQAVRDCLHVEGTRPMFLLSPTCVNTRKALNGGYRWRKVKIVGVDRYDPEPEKNQASHTADGLQYLALLEGGYAKALGRKASDANAVADMMRRQGFASGTRLGRGSSGAKPLMIGRR